MTKEERTLWYDFLRDYPIKTTRQKVVGKYVVDFYCAEANLAIEVDGGGHYEEEQVLHDKKRTEFLSTFSIKVIRFTNLEVRRNFKGVCEEIDRVIKTLITP